MSLKHIVPTLGLMAALTPAAMAADVGGLTIKGYVDTILEIQSYDEAVAPGVTNDGDADDTEVDFTASAQTELSYKIGSNITANMELFYADRSAGPGPGRTINDNGTPTDPSDDFAEAGEEGHDLVVEQAFIEWAVNDQVSLAMGKFHSFIGWEGNDAPELYRVNWSQLWNYTGDRDLTGLGVGIAATENVDIGVYLVDGIWGGENGATGQKELADLALGASVTFKAKGLGLFDLDLAYDMNATADEDGEEADALMLDFNGEIDALRDDSGVLFFWDLLYVDQDAISTLAFMFGANMDLKTETPMSLTGMISYVDPNDDDDLGGEDDEIMEIAIALLVNPTKDENFALNLEGRYIDRGADDSSEFGIFVEALAVIP